MALVIFVTSMLVGRDTCLPNSYTRYSLVRLPKANIGLIGQLTYQL